MKHVKDHLSYYQAPRILDIGTGSGQFVSLLRECTTDDAEIIGIDTFEQAINQATSRFIEFKNCSFEVMDAAQLDFDDASFDVISISNSLHHLENPSAIFEEIHRCLKVGGILLVNEMAKDHLTKAQGSHRLLHHFAADIDKANGIFHDDTMTKKQIILFLENYSKESLVKIWPMDVDKHVTASPEDIQRLIHTVDVLLSRIKDPIYQQKLKTKANRIKNHIRKYGFDSATSYFVILKK
ncbi:MAG: class I SAM-dependent methyltransferase [bacterium]|nr:class I SAM-dependent methyltransferase [bacterium]